MPWPQRIRFGLHILRSRYRAQWKWLYQIPAKPWLIEDVGEEAYNVIWHPLLRVKFGEYHDKISAAWIWHRIWRVAQSRRWLWGREMFGCLEHGSATLVEPLVKWIREQPGASVRLGVKVQPLQVVDGRITQVRVGEEIIPCDAVISTVALPTLDRLIPDRNDDYFARARQVKFIGVVCAVLSL